MRALERTYRRRVDPRQVVSPELARHLAEISHRIGRQVGVLLGRDGIIRNVVVGDATSLTVPDVGRLRGGVGRFRGLRLVHTHLRGEPLTRDDLNDLVLLRLDLIAAIEVLGDGLPGRIDLAHLAPVAGEEEGEAGEGGAGGEQGAYVRLSAADLHRLDFDVVATLRALEEEAARGASRGGDTGKERALVVALRHEEEHFAETLELVRAAGVAVAGTVRQKRGTIHPKTVVGSGKLQDIVLEGMRRRASVAIFDIDLKPGQARAFEDATGLKAIDRTQLILDVFAQRARSRDGKLQVELAQLRYSLPRLTERDAGLSRLAGGIGGRGPGETVMEIGRRRIRDRIRALERQVEGLSRQRDLRRRKRRDEGVPVLSIVGYTNAGKSTLLNALTGSEVEAADQLFMTLDPTSRRLRFPREGEVVITDTVGFIAELPKDLVAAFRATLEELADADLLLNVADIADPRLDHKLEAVARILGELHLDEIPRLVVLNKCDLLPPAEVAALVRRHDALAVSATARTGLPQLVQAAEDRLNRDRPLLRPDNRSYGRAAVDAAEAEATEAEKTAEAEEEAKVAAAEEAVGRGGSDGAEEVVGHGGSGKAEVVGHGGSGKAEVVGTVGRGGSGKAEEAVGTLGRGGSGKAEVVVGTVGRGGSGEAEAVVGTVGRGGSGEG